MLEYLAAFGAIYLLAATGTDLFVGRLGMLPFFSGALMAVGAYALAILTADYSVSWFVAWLIAASITGLVSMAATVLSLAGGREKFSVVTFGVQMAVVFSIGSADSMTGGLRGIMGVARPTFPGLSSSDGLVIFIAVVALLVAGGEVSLRHSGLFARATVLRESPLLLVSFGRSQTAVVVAVSGLAGLLLGMAGASLASYVRYIDPPMFGLHLSLTMLTASILGGAGRAGGPVLGVLVVLLVPEALAQLVGTTSQAPAIREMISGCLIIGALALRPRGLLTGFDLSAPRHD